VRMKHAEHSVIFVDIVVVSFCAEVMYYCVVDV